ncbi:hypothetical protein FQZ97_695670 [compost metagenome]
MHLHHPANALFLALHRVQYGVTGSQDARVNTSEGQGTHEGVGRDLERQSREGLGVISTALVVDLVVISAVRVDALNRRDLGRGRQVVDHGIENQGHALVLEGRAANSRNDFASQSTSTQTSLDFLGSQLTLFQVLVHQLFIGFSGSLNHVVAPLFGQLPKLGRDLLLTVGSTLVVFVPVDRLHLDQVDLALEVVLGTDCQLNRNRGVTQTVLDLTDYAQEVGTGTVHLVDVDDARHAVLVGLTPYGLGLRLNAGSTAEHDDSTVEHAQRALYFDGEVNVAGGVDDVYTIVVILTTGTFPEGRYSSGGNGDTALLLLHHPVGSGGAIVHLTHFVAETCVEQDPLRSGGLTGVYVGADTDVTVAVDRGCTSHEKILARLEAIMREGLVGLCHAVHVFTLLDSGAFAIEGIQQLACETQGHGFFATLARGLNQPTHGQGITTGRANFDRNLVSGTAYTAGLDFDQRSDGVESFLEDFQGIAVLARFDGIQGTVNDALGYGLLAAFHHVVHELGENQASVFRIVQNLTLGCYTTSWH